MCILNFKGLLGPCISISKSPFFKSWGPKGPPDKDVRLYKGLLLYKKSLNKGYVPTKSILKHGSVYQKFPTFVKNGPIFSRKVPFLPKWLLQWVGVFRLQEHIPTKPNLSTWITHEYFQYACLIRQYMYVKPLMVPVSFFVLWLYCIL